MPNNALSARRLCATTSSPSGSAMRSTSPLPAAAARTLLSAGGAPDVLLVLVDQLTNVPGVTACLRTGVGYRAAEADIIANDVDAGGILEEVVYICLANPETPVDVSAIVSLATFGHCCALLSEVIYLECGKQQADGRCGAQPMRSAATGSVFVARRAGM